MAHSNSTSETSLRANNGFALELRMAQDALDRAADSIFWHDLEGNILYVNYAAANALGYTREELLKKTVPDLDPNFTLDAAQQLWLTIQQQGSIRIETHHSRKDGSTIPVEATLNHLSFDGKEYLCVFARDLSERKRAERDLRLAQLTIEQAADGIFWSDLTGQVLFVNNAACKNLGYTREEILQMNILDFDPETSRDAAAQIWEPMRELKTVSLETIHQRKDGNLMPVDVTAAYFEFEDQEIICSFVRDNTERKRAETERLTLQEQLIEAQRSALRELSTPLIPITDDVVIMPLIGTIDSARAQQVMETLLEGIAHHSAETVILDITGVQVVDTQVANALIHAAQAVRLLGAQLVMTGIQPQIAQTLVHLGADLRDIITRSTLQAGIAYATAQKGLRG
jgi:rsbT co-antagonist protein RsbR